MRISLCKISKDLAWEYYWELTYSEPVSDAQYERQMRLGREYLAVMLEDAVIGEIVFKEIDRADRHCSLSIHLKNDSVKNQGFGTLAEEMALAYAFDTVGMDPVYVDAVLKNKRSRYVLEKIGLKCTHCEGIFRYYKCCKALWESVQQ